MESPNFSSEQLGLSTAFPSAPTRTLALAFLLARNCRDCFQSVFLRKYCGGDNQWIEKKDANLEFLEIVKSDLQLSKRQLETIAKKDIALWDVQLLSILLQNLNPSRFAQQFRDEETQAVTTISNILFYFQSRRFNNEEISEKAYIFLTEKLWKACLVLIVPLQEFATVFAESYRASGDSEWPSSPSESFLVKFLEDVTGAFRVSVRSGSHDSWRNISGCNEEEFWYRDYSYDTIRVWHRNNEQSKIRLTEEQLWKVLNKEPNEWDSYLLYTLLSSYLNVADDVFCQLFPFLEDMRGIINFSAFNEELVASAEGIMDSVFGFITECRGDVVKYFPGSRSIENGNLENTSFLELTISPSKESTGMIISPTTLVVGNFDILNSLRNSGSQRWAIGFTDNFDLNDIECEIYYDKQYPAWMVRRFDGGRNGVKVERADGFQLRLAPTDCSNAIPLEDGDTIYVGAKIDGQYKNSLYVKNVKTSAIHERDYQLHDDSLNGYTIIGKAFRGNCIVPASIGKSAAFYKAKDIEDKVYVVEVPLVKSKASVIQTEIDVLMDLGGARSVITPHQIIFQKKNRIPVLVSKWARFGTLSNILRNKVDILLPSGSLTGGVDAQMMYFKRILDIMVQIAGGCEYAHRKNIIHGHLSAEKVLLLDYRSDDCVYFDIKLFGFHSHGVPDDIMTPKKDVWNIGMIFLQLLSAGKVEPMSDLCNIEVVQDLQAQLGGLEWLKEIGVAADQFIQLLFSQENGLLAITESDRLSSLELVTKLRGISGQYSFVSDLISPSKSMDIAVARAEVCEKMLSYFKSIGARQYEDFIRKNIAKYADYKSEQDQFYMHLLYLLREQWPVREHDFINTMKSIMNECSANQLEPLLELYRWWESAKSVVSVAGDGSVSIKVEQLAGKSLNFTAELFHYASYMEGMNKVGKVIKSCSNGKLFRLVPAERYVCSNVRCEEYPFSGFVNFDDAIERALDSYPACRSICFSSSPTWKFTNEFNKVTGRFSLKGGLPTEVVDEFVQSWIIEEVTEAIDDTVVVTGSGVCVPQLQEYYLNCLDNLTEKEQLDPLFLPALSHECPVEIVQKILDKSNSSVLLKDKFLNNPLHLLLSRTGYMPDVIETMFNSIVEACEKQTLSVQDVLKENNIDDIDNFDILAIVTRNPAIAPNLVARIIDKVPLDSLKRRYSHNFTPLHWYITHAHDWDSVLQQLVEKNMDGLRIRAMSDDGTSGGYPVHCAMQNPCIENLFDDLLRLHPRAPIKRGPNGEVPLVTALANHLPDSITFKLLDQYLTEQQFLSDKQGCATFDDAGNYPLHVAIQKGASLDVIIRLLAIYPQATGKKNHVGSLPRDYIDVWAPKCCSDLASARASLLDVLQKAQLDYNALITEQENFADIAITEGVEEVETMKAIENKKVHHESDDEGFVPETKLTTPLDDEDESITKSSAPMFTGRKKRSENKHEPKLIAHGHTLQKKSTFDRHSSQQQQHQLQQQQRGGQQHQQNRMGPHGKQGQQGQHQQPQYQHRGNQYQPQYGHNVQHQGMQPPQHPNAYPPQHHQPQHQQYMQQHQQPPPPHHQQPPPPQQSSAHHQQIPRSNARNAPSRGPPQQQQQYKGNEQSGHSQDVRHADTSKYVPQGGRQPVEVYEDGPPEHRMQYGPPRNMEPPMEGPPQHMMRGPDHMYPSHEYGPGPNPMDAHHEHGGWQQVPPHMSNMQDPRQMHGRMPPQYGMPQGPHPSEIQMYQNMPPQGPPPQQHNAPPPQQQQDNRGMRNRSDYPSHEKQHPPGPQLVTPPPPQQSQIQEPKSQYQPRPNPQQGHYSEHSNGSEPRRASMQNGSRDDQRGGQKNTRGGPVRYTPNSDGMQGTHSLHVPAHLSTTSPEDSGVGTPTAGGSIPPPSPHNGSSQMHHAPQQRQEQQIHSGPRSGAGVNQGRHQVPEGDNALPQHNSRSTSQSSYGSQQQRQSSAPNQPHGQPAQGHNMSQHNLSQQSNYGGQPAPVPLQNSHSNPNVPHGQTHNVSQHQSPVVVGVATGHHQGGQHSGIQVPPTHASGATTPQAHTPTHASQQHGHQQGPQGGPTQPPSGNSNTGSDFVDGPRDSGKHRTPRGMTGNSRAGPPQHQHHQQMSNQQQAPPATQQQPPQHHMQQQQQMHHQHQQHSQSSVQQQQQQSPQNQQQQTQGQQPPPQQIPPPAQPQQQPPPQQSQQHHHQGAPQGPAAAARGEQFQNYNRNSPNVMDSRNEIPAPPRSEMPPEDYGQSQTPMNDRGRMSYPSTPQSPANSVNYGYGVQVSPQLPPGVQAHPGVQPVMAVPGGQQGAARFIPQPYPQQAGYYQQVLQVMASYPPGTTAYYPYGTAAAPPVQVGFYPVPQTAVPAGYGAQMPPQMHAAGQQAAMIQQHVMPPQMTVQVPVQMHMPPQHAQHQVPPQQMIPVVQQQLSSPQQQLPQQQMPHQQHQQQPSQQHSSSGPPRYQRGGDGSGSEPSQQSQQRHRGQGNPRRN